MESPLFQLLLFPAGPLLLLAYLLGSIPTAIWVSKGLYNTDIRQRGSGNAGSTNVYRVLGARAGIMVQVVDIAKGSVAALLFHFPFLFYESSADLPVELLQWEMWLNDPLHRLIFSLLCGLLAVLGHVYTVLAGFKGGKGVNTMLGMMLVIAPLGSLAAVLVFLALLFSFRMVSVGSMGGVAAFAAYQLVQYLRQPEPAAGVLLGIGLLLTVFIVFTHRGNIARIRNGTESKVYLGKKKVQN
jgi:glycerol-3-phosphate acyltransferase PlsY